MSGANEKVDKLKTLLRGLENGRVDLIAKLGEIQAQTREAKNCQAVQMRSLLQNAQGPMRR